MRLEVNGVTVDTVELVTLEVLHTGGVESKYGQDYDYQFKPRNRHAIGMKRCRFTIRKWYKADSSNTDLFYTLFDNDTEFTLKEYLAGLTGFAGLTITGCEIYNYTPTTGAANDIIQEEIIGEGTFYEEDIVIPSGECVSWLENNSDYDNNTWLDSVTIRAGQRITITGETVCRVYFKFLMLPTGDNWALNARIRRVSDDSIIETSPTVHYDEDLSTTVWTWISFEFNSFVDEEVRILAEFSRVNGGVLLWNTNPSISGSHTRYTSGVYTDDSNHDAGIKIYTKEL